ncbi:glycosyltransferase family 2 protein [bacterium]|nr:glycosyltransferase family 2 protein [bacterium]
MKLSVLIPIHNEEATLQTILQRVAEIENQAAIDSLEIVAVDDCSSDNSFEILNNFAKHHKIEIIRHPVNLGKGAALRNAVAKASGDFTIFQDADLEYDPSDIVRMAEFAESSSSAVVYGSRFLGKSTSPLGKAHYLVNRGLTLFSNLFTGLHLTDMETCYKMIRTDILKRIDLEENRFGIEPEITAKIARLSKTEHFSVSEIPISYKPRKSADGKKIGLKDGFRALYVILKYGIRFL